MKLENSQTAYTFLVSLFKNIITSFFKNLCSIAVNELISALGKMSEEEFKKKYNTDKPNFDSEIIFSCRSGRRSLQALGIALKLGYKK